MKSELKKLSRLGPREWFRLRDRDLWQAIHFAEQARSKADGIISLGKDGSSSTDAELLAAVDVWIAAQERVAVIWARKITKKTIQLGVPLPTGQENRKQSEFWNEWYFTDEALQKSLERIREAEAHQWAGNREKLSLYGLVVMVVIAIAGWVTALS